MAMKQHAYQIPSFFSFVGCGDDGIFVVPNVFSWIFQRVPKISQ